MLNAYNQYSRLNPILFGKFPFEIIFKNFRNMKFILKKIQVRILYSNCTLIYVKYYS